MKKIVKYVGLDVHKDSTTIAIADDGRDGEVRFYGKITNDLDQIDKVMRKRNQLSGEEQMDQGPYELADDTKNGASGPTNRLYRIHGRLGKW